MMAENFGSGIPFFKHTIKQMKIPHADIYHLKIKRNIF